jgi:hypothetical protein
MRPGPHIVAVWIGGDSTVLLRNFVKRKRAKAADASLADAIDKFAAGFLGTT